MHMGGCTVVFRGSFHGVGGTGDRHRRPFTGGAANGTPRNTTVSLAALAPMTGPLVVMTTGGLSTLCCAAATAADAARAANTATTVTTQRMTEYAASCFRLTMDALRSALADPFVCGSLSGAAVTFLFVTLRSGLAKRARRARSSPADPTKKGRYELQIGVLSWFNVAAQHDGPVVVVPYLHVMMVYSIRQCAVVVERDLDDRTG